MSAPVVLYQRFVLPSQLKGGEQLQGTGAAAPSRIFNASAKIGAVRMSRDDLRRLVDRLHDDLPKSRADFMAATSSRARRSLKSI